MALVRQGCSVAVKVVWTGTFEPGFSRNGRLARLMELSGVDVTVIRQRVWDSNRVGVAVKGKRRAVFRALAAYPLLLWRLLWVPAPDLYLVSYPGWLDVPVVRLVAWIRRRPLVFDPFISLYDTMVLDRKLFTERSVSGRLALFFDRVSLRLADAVMADTEPHLRYYDSLSPGVREKGCVLPLGSVDEIFRPRDDVEPDPTLVVFHGTFVPLQGLATIVEAARLLEDEGIRFLIIGDGQDRPVLERLVDEHGLTNVNLIGLVPLDDIPRLVASGAICLGIFGSSDKANRVAPHKLYECLAVGRPVITRASEAVGSLFQEGEVVAVPPADPEALANAIRDLVTDPLRRTQIADAGHRAYRDRFQEEVLASTLHECLTRVVV
jgi:glycosyltransferase involved in cell wall biosynthesis